MLVYVRGTRWWISYYSDGTHYRESVVRTTGKNTETAAKALLKRRLGEIEAHTWVGPDEKRVRLSNLRRLAAANSAGIGESVYPIAISNSARPSALHCVQSSTSAVVDGLLNPPGHIG